MEIINARVRHARRAPEFDMVEAIIRLKVRDTLRPMPYDMDVLSFAPVALARKPGAMRQYLIEAATSQA
ncbi:hypothetical protein ACMU_03335 [Actibacterium mucosum KCTC 23349]|uniref:Uncharacterized protein n=1 Tax=Actibacterium mucosum KCTC 23349 TaxID=1454373 RepID=A0A037ZRR7_9RHOB|nr:hypothetical protein [Actibacterium mucosum]KAJ57552.1 hypothetical protein ACMU_03335 [Actibacterium mucosum KCTC 23349]